MPARRSKKSLPKKKKSLPKEKEKKSLPKEKKLSPYMVFSKEKRPEIKAKYPKLTFGGVGKALGAEWRKLSKAQKEKYAQ